MRKFILMVFLLLSYVFVYGGYISFNDTSTEAYTVKVISQSDNEVVVDFNLNGLITDYITINGKKYTSFDIPGAVNYLKKGMPELPHINENIIVGNMGKVKLSVISEKTTTMKFAPPVPSKGNLFRNVNPASVKYKFSDKYYTESFPPTEIGISKPFIMRDYRGVNIEINPIVYDPIKGDYTIVKSIRFSIENTSTPGVNEIKGKAILEKMDKDFDNIYRTTFLNYRDVQYRYPAVKEQGGMLIITADNFYDTMMPFYLWKLQKGIPCKMVKLSDIGGNNADSIKNYIQKEYDADTIAYILLVGDGNDIVPDTGTYGAASGADCDPVYTYLSGDDYYPDAIIGRFSSSNVTDIENMVDRSINYEMNPDTSGSWYHLAMGLGSTQGSPSDSQRIAWLKDSLLTYNYTNVDLMIDGYQNATDVSNALNEGRGCVYYCGHGSVTGWATPSYSNSNVQSLSNNGMLPFVQSVACVVGDFNGNDCFAENWLKAGTPSSPAGGIAFYGSTINQSWIPPTVSQTEFIHLLINEINTTIGALYFNGSCKMIEDYGATATDGVEMFQTWTIFGDPSIQVRTNTPVTMTVNHDPNIVVGQSSFDVSTPGVVNALCGLYDPSDSTLVAHGYTDASGNITLKLNPAPTTSGILVLTVTAMNKIPVVDTIDVVVPSGPYVTYLSSIVNDGSGNNNGQINPGESIDLGVYLKNFGSDTAHGVYAKISTSDTFVTLTQDSVYFGDINANDSLLGTGMYKFSVGQVPNGYNIPFNMTIVSAETTWNSSFSLVSYAPLISREEFSIDDASSGNGNGRWDVGEQVNLIFGIKNMGGEEAKNVKIAISTSTPGITIDDGNAVIGDIESDSLKSNDSDALVATSGNDVSQGTPVEIDYTISGDNFGEISGSVSSVVGRKAYIIFDIASSKTGVVMDSILSELGYSGDYYTSFSPMIDSLNNYASAFVFAGVYSNNAIIDQTNGGKLASWCRNDGGMLYLEGGDMWYYDPQYANGYDFSSLCGVNATNDGSSDLATIGGMSGRFTNGMSFTYSGENNYIDHIDATGTGFVIFSNSSPAYNCGIANDGGSYRTVGMSFEFSGLSDGSGVSTKLALADSIMHFFGLGEQGVKEQREILGRRDRVSFGIRAIGSNIVEGGAEFMYGITRDGEVRIEVYDASGREVKSLVKGEVKRGNHRVSWNGRDNGGRELKEGVYFVRLSSGNMSRTMKLLLMK